MRIFDHNDFKSLIRGKIKNLPDRGHGSYSKIAKFLGIHTTSLSQIMAGKKPLSLEHASLISDFFSFSELEAEFFLLLVQRDRAGNHSLRERFENQLGKIRRESSELANIVPSTKQKLTFEQQATFYSDKHYSLIRVLTSLPEFQSVEAITSLIQLPLQMVKEKMHFLLQTGLCIPDGDKIKPGPTYTHLESESAFISKHHGNWRIHAMQRHANLSKEELAYSSLMSISREDAKKVRSLLTEIIKQTNGVRDQSEPEVLRCLCIDWVSIK
jgi:uncharacterized protein (TIGR02147 family)